MSRHCELINAAFYSPWAVRTSEARPARVKQTNGLQKCIVMGFETGATGEQSLFRRIAYRTTE